MILLEPKSLDAHSFADLFLQSLLSSKRHSCTGQSLWAFKPDFSTTGLGSEADRRHYAMNTEDELDRSFAGMTDPSQAVFSCAGALA